MCCDSIQFNKDFGIKLLTLVKAKAKLIRCHSVYLILSVLNVCSVFSKQAGIDVGVT